MANLVTEEFALPLAGREYRFHFGLHECIEMQERLITATEMPTLLEIDIGVRQGRLKYRRALLWAGLRHFQPTLTEGDVTHLMASASAEETQAVLRAFGYSSTPDALDVEALGITPESNPPKAQTETIGADSTSEAAVSV